MILKISHFILHLNICSLQAYFDELLDFLQEFSSLPSLIFVSETRINNNPMINIDIHIYFFVHFLSPAKAGGVGAYLSTLGQVDFENQYGAKCQ